MNIDGISGGVSGLPESFLSQVVQLTTTTREPSFISFIL